MKIKFVYLDGGVEFVETNYIYIQPNLEYVTYWSNGGFITVYIKSLQYVLYEGFQDFHSIHNNEYKG